MFDAGWYVQLHGERDGGGAPLELAFMLPDHESLPPALRRAFDGQGMTSSNLSRRLRSIKRAIFKVRVILMRDETHLFGLKNIGHTIAARCEAVGIKTVGDLRAIATAKAYKRIKAGHPGTTIPVCYYLYSLQGALDGVHWDALSPAVKEKLLKEAGVKRLTNRSSRRAKARG